VSSPFGAGAATGIHRRLHPPVRRSPASLPDRKRQRQAAEPRAARVSDPAVPRLLFGGNLQIAEIIGQREGQFLDF
jgi:hypothetical protein